MKIEDYSFGRMRMDGVTYESDLIVLPHKVVTDWWRKQGHSLCLEDLEEVLAEKPACLVVGTGAAGIMNVPDETVKAVEASGIRLIVEPTGEAVKTFNRLQGKGRIAGAFHLTC